MGRLRDTPIPNEHGIYVVLAGSWLLGVIHAPTFNPVHQFLMLIAGIGGTVLVGSVRELTRSIRNPSRRRYRKRYLIWTACSAAVTAAASAPVAVKRIELLWLALPLAIVGVAYFRLRGRRRPLVLQSLAGFAGVTLLAPATIIASTGATDMGRLIGTWILALFFFAGSALCVNIRLAGRPMLLPTGLYIATSLLLALLSGFYGIVPLLAVTGLGFGALRYALIALGLNTYLRMSLKLIGLGESALTLLFLLANALSPV